MATKYPDFTEDSRQSRSEKFMNIRKTTGFTLIEPLIYAAIVAGFITVSLSVVYQMIDFSGRLRNQREINENQRFLIQKLDWILNSADTINSPPLGGSGNTLSVNKLNFAQNPLVVDADGGAVRLSSGGGLPVPLTNNYASTTNLIFEHLNFSGQSALRITGTLFNASASTSIDATIIVK